MGSEAKVEITQIFRLGKKLTPLEQAGATVAEQKPRLMMIKLKDREKVNQLIKGIIRPFFQNIGAIQRK